jgi:transcriptional regulator with XRE-family HTH domain
MATGDSPIVARRRLQSALRGARNARAMTQGQVAEEMEWSLSKVMRIEKGEVGISVSDLRGLLGVLEITDPAEVKSLLDDARAARNTPSTLLDVREHLTNATYQLLQYEAEAQAIRYFSLVLIPGVLQTEEYARAVFDQMPNRLAPETVDARMANRLRRRDRVLYSENPPQFLVLLDESVLHREVGGPHVMAEQLRVLLNLMRQTQVMVRIVPSAGATTLALLGPFQIVDLRKPDDSLLYRESPFTDDISYSNTLVSDHRKLFEELWSDALDDAASANLIAERAAKMAPGG